MMTSDSVLFEQKRFHNRSYWIKLDETADKCFAELYADGNLLREYTSDILKETQSVAMQMKGIENTNDTKDVNDINKFSKKEDFCDKEIFNGLDNKMACSLTLSTSENEVEKSLLQLSAGKNQTNASCAPEDNVLHLKTIEDFKIKANISKKNHPRKLMRSKTIDDANSKKIEETLKNYSSNKRRLMGRSWSTSSERNSISSNAPLMTPEVTSKQQTLPKRKVLQRSFSSCFSRIKQISVFQMKTHQKFYSEDGVSDELEETECVNAQLVHNLRKCISVPDSLNGEDLDGSKLFLPRRMAICSEVRTPALKQLKAYLVLTRLKQYNFL